MKALRYSLRIRLLVLILLPLILVSSLAIYWRFTVARTTAESIFDRNLVMLTFAVSRDIALSEGDSLTSATSNMFRQISGDDVYYHAFGPDGSFVAGYGTPPINPNKRSPPDRAPSLFSSTHLGVPVRAAQLTQLTKVAGISGASVVTVWQKLDQRALFARSLAERSAIIAGLLVATVGVLVFFGIRIGLRPLVELEQAIQKRTLDDLSPILRQVPPETLGIVSRLNTLFAQVSADRETRDRLISNAAHQLRNPIAAIHTMAQATRNAKSLPIAQNRADALVAETRYAKRMTDQLLSFERLDGKKTDFTDLNFTDLVTETCAKTAAQAMTAGIDFSLNLSDRPLFVRGDSMLLSEAIQNIFDNGMKHGGQQLSRIKVCLRQSGKYAQLCIENDGADISFENSDRIFDRFTQGSESPGSGLGLAITREILQLHLSDVVLLSGSPPVFSLELPLIG